MELYEILLIVLGLLLTYGIVVFILHKKGILEKYNISFWGPALMWRTKRGRAFLRKIAEKKRFWKAFGSSGIVLCFIFMFLMVLLLVWQTWSILETPEQVENLPGIEAVFVIPGINPIIPLEYFWYVIIALIVAMIVHEFSHGILSYASGLKVKALGLIYMIVPLGAFCEPDEEELKETKRVKRMRVFAAGPTSNFIIVLISIVLFSFVLMSAVQPAAEGPIVLSMFENSPVENAGIPPGSIITAFNNTEITNISNLRNALENTHPQQAVSVRYNTYGESHETTVTLTDYYDEVIERGGQKNESLKNTSFLGAQYLNPIAFNNFLTSLKNPFGSLLNFSYVYIIPFFGYLEGYNPIADPFTASYVITGPLHILPSGVFWQLVNLMYWIFWLNLAVAIFNVLPIVPLDGGYLFRDLLNGLGDRLIKNKDKESREKFVQKLTLTISLTLFFIILLPFILKYLFELF